MYALRHALRGVVVLRPALRGVRLLREVQAAHGARRRLLHLRERREEGHGGAAEHFAYENTKVGKVLYPPPIELCRLMVPEGKELVGSARSPSAFLEYLDNSLQKDVKRRQKT